MTIERIMNELIRSETPPDAFNQYAPGSSDNAIRCENLRRYLQKMQSRQPKTLMLMEAPGYRGCRLTGVPVTSRRVLLEGVPELELFGTERGYQDVSDAGFERIYGEQSATIVWDTLAALGRAPLIWNTYPFHPHKSGKAQSNRKPRKDETTRGGEFIQQILALYRPEVVIAVGNVAEDTLTEMGVSCVKVRHPAQGGKNDFVAGMEALLT